MSNWILAGLIAAIAAGYLVLTSELPSTDLSDPLGPAAFPIFVGILGLVSAAWVVVETIVRRLRSPAQEGPATSVEAEPPPDRRTLIGMAFLLVWTFGFYLCLEPLGFAISSFVYLIGLGTAFNRGRWKMNLIASAGITALTLVLFTGLLGIRLPAGPITF
jgi:putative tricarboxylic transport membrane protein